MADDVLHKKIGPFPVVVWGGIVVGGIGAGLLLRKFGASSGEKGAPSGADEAATEAPDPIVAIDRQPVGYVYEGEPAPVRTERPPEPTPTPGNSGGTSPTPTPGNSGGTSPTPTPGNPPANDAAPGPVSGLSATRQGNAIVLRWNRAPNATKYHIQRWHRDRPNVIEGNFYTNGETSYTDSNFQPGNLVYAVRAWNAGKYSAYVQTTIAVPIPQSQPGTGGGNQASYPGLPPGYQMNCQTTSLRHIVPNLNQVDTRGLSSTSKARKLASWAVLNNGGEPTIPGFAYIWASGIHQPSVRERVNKVRVANGLYPLTNADFDEMEQDMRGMMPNEYRSERETIYQNLTYANRLFDKYNRPYQCGSVGIRTDRSNATRGVGNPSS